MKKNAGKIITLKMQVMETTVVTEEGARRCGKCSVIG